MIRTGGACMFEPILLPDLALCALPPRTRLVLRCNPALLGAIGAAFGVVPPATPLAAAERGSRAALCLGPDEWLLLAEEGAADALVAALEAARAGLPASIVEVSHRQLAFAVSGPAAASLLNEGCPLDLEASAFPPGRATRTLFGKVEILLWRPLSRPGGEPRFELEVARSFAAPLWALLAEAAADLGG